MNKEDASSSEYLAFNLGQEEYAVDILKVQEIRGYKNVTRIANSPEYLRGVINLRGTIVPVIDMRIRFNMGAPSYDQFTVVIILNVGGKIVGMVVDSVSDVTNLTSNQIKPAPQIGTLFDTDYLTGLATINNRVLILLNIDRLVLSNNLNLVEQIPA